MQRRRRFALLWASALTLIAAQSAAASEPDALASGFRDPPQSARPRVWWHWMSGNVSAEGARLDLDWMRRIGVGGVHAFSGGKLPEPVVVAKPLPYMSPGWQEVFRQSLDQAHAAGMEVAIAGSPGWSETGGPWVAPADAMKKYVWSETVVDGGKRFHGKLAAPPAVTGPFQGKGAADAKGQAYGDAAVLAFPTPALDRPLPAAQWSSSKGPLDLAALSSEDFARTGSVKLPLSGAEPVWLEADFPQAVTLSALTVGLQEGGRLAVQAERSPGVFETVREARLEPRGSGADALAPQTTLSFAPATARRFRILLQPPPPKPLTPVAAMTPPLRMSALTLTQLRLIGGPRIEAFEAKAGFEPTVPADSLGGAEPPRDAVIGRGAVIDVSGRMAPDGTLDWTPPPGRWTILRLGWSLTGRVNAPAEPGATGLEVDKLDAAAVQRYLDNYLRRYEQASGDRLGPSGVQALLTDSWEAGVQNWTPSLPAAFRMRRGYDLTPFLPVLTGRIVESREASERFLFDFRRTLEELVADNHYGVLAREAHARGMSYYSEAQGDAPRAIFDGMAVKARADIPTAEFWYRPFSTGPGQPPLKADLAEAASVGHLYGKPFVAAESLTVGAVDDPWAFSPAMLKPVADEIFARGINRILLHESHHQPLVDAKPGLKLFIFGQYFNRNDTWAEYAGPWVSYLARTSYLLQQGRYVADVAYFYGEERNLTDLFRERYDPGVPTGYGYDFVGPEALLSLLSVRDGRIVTPSGMSYRLLYMPEHVRRLSLPALQKLRALVADGAVLVGPKPVGGLGLASTDAEVRRIADEIWGEGEGTPNGRPFGTGRVYLRLEAALAAEQIRPDVAFEGASAGDEPLSLHRRTDQADIYFISNQSDQAQKLTARFRVSGRSPEVWRAETGSIEPLSYRATDQGVETPLDLAPHEALFVIFRRPAEASSWTAAEVRRTELAALDGAWRVSFEPGRGAPRTAVFPHLISWPDAKEPGIKYFSGAATYSTTIRAPRAWFRPGRRVELELGEVRELAAVSVNGRPVATAWHAPYSVDLTGALKPGANKLEITVVNLWPNRLIGDKQPGAQPVAFAPDSPYRANSPLRPSGLIGPVRIMAADRGSTPGR